MAESSYDDTVNKVNEQLNKDHPESHTVVPVGMNLHMAKLEDGDPFVSLCIKDISGRMTYMAMSVEQFESFAMELYTIVTTDKNYREHASN